MFLLETCLYVSLPRLLICLYHIFFVPFMIARKIFLSHNEWGLCSLSLCLLFILYCSFYQFYLLSFIFFFSFEMILSLLNFREKMSFWQHQAMRLWLWLPTTLFTKQKSSIEAINFEVFILGAQYITNYKRTRGIKFIETRLQFLY